MLSTSTFPDPSSGDWDAGKVLTFSQPPLDSMPQTLCEFPGRGFGEGDGVMFHFRSKNGRILRSGSTRLQTRLFWRVIEFLSRLAHKNNYLIGW